MEIEEKFVLDKNNDIIIGQLEITNALEFLNKYKNKIDDIISDVYNEYQVKYVCINIIDILKGYHFIYSHDERCIQFLENKFNEKISNGIYKEDRIVLRKEIKKYLKQKIK